MFKYISDILAQFTRAQRILALLMVLVSIILITLTPSVIDALKTDTSSLNRQIARQNLRIEQLEIYADTLNDKLREQEMRCTNDMYSREAEFVHMLEDIKNDIKSRDGEARASRRIYATIKRSGEPDSSSSDKVMAMPEPEPIQQLTKSPNMKPVISKIESMQKKLGKR